jgi:hypothetical protein
MAPEYTEKLFGRLAAANSDIAIHYEIRPNFSRTQLARMQRGGLRSVLPGVESFSTNILKSMRKFTTGMRNIELVKWCTHYRMNVTYNILCRFPGETVEDYREQCDIIAKIPHFQPPYAAVMARADRGSPMFTDPASQSISRLIPFKCYQYIFPRGKFDLPRISYFFDQEMTNIAGEPSYTATFAAVDNWRAKWNQPKKPYLTYRKAWSTIFIIDGRQREARTFRYYDQEAALYEYCSDARTPRDIAANFGPAAWVKEALQRFVEKDLMLFLDGRYLSLALPENRNFQMEAGSVAKTVATPEQPSQAMS